MGDAKTFDYDVFLSYSSKDKEKVHALAERLKSDGLRVWLDAWAIRPGDSIPLKIQQGLEQSRTLLMCMSPAYFASEWGVLEHHTLIFRDPTNQQRRFIPLLMEDCTRPDIIAHFAHIDWLGPSDNAYEKLLAACCERAPRKASFDAPKDKAGRMPIVLKGHTDFVMGVAITPNGKTIISGSKDMTLRVWDLETGRCRAILKGHTKRVFGPAVTPDGKTVVSGSFDKTLKVWDLKTGRCRATFEGNTEPIVSVAVTPDGKTVVSGSNDNTLKVWDLETGRCKATLGGHNEAILIVAATPDGKTVVSGSADNTLKVWDLETGRCRITLNGHTETVSGVAVTPDGKTVVSGSDDETLKVWDLETGRCRATLEGHTQGVWGVAVTPDGKKIISGSQDHMLKIWDLETGRCQATLEGHTRAVRSVAVSPDGKTIVSGSYDNTLRVWDLDQLIPLSQPIPLSVTYTSAKIVLVGDTGVGKSGLAERLICGKFVPTESSHARRAYILESQVVKDSGNSEVHRETVLWDLAGQPAYRLVHQLSMEDAALACVLFDARSETNPFEGAAYWSQVLDQIRTNTKKRMVKFLVASRSDVGGLPAGAERIDAFVRENGFSGFFATSAKTGQGCDELLQAIRQSIPWKDLPSVSSPEVLRKLREFIYDLNPARNVMKAGDVPAMMTIAELLQRFESAHKVKVPQEEFISYLERLEATDTADVLVFHSTEATPKPEDKVLLDTTRIDAYASALLVTARDEPDGPGHLLESRAHNGEFTLAASERIDSDLERHLLWFVVESLLSRDLALRERIKKKDYLVFPSQCTTGLPFPGGGSFAVAFSIAGPARSIYATLIAQLAHYEGFKRRQFFQNAAAYQIEDGQRCYVQLFAPSSGPAELQISFDDNTPEAVRQGFIEFIARHVESKSETGEVPRRYAYYCSNDKCRNPFEDRVVKARLKDHKRYLICPICESQTPLADLLAPPNAAARKVARQIDSNAKAGRQRITASWVIKAKEEERKFDVFLSHNSKDKAEVEKIAKQLLSVGLRPWLDKWNLAPGDTISDALEKAIKTIPCAVLCFGPADVGNWHLMEIRAYVEAWAKKEARMIPLILPGVKETPELPLFVRQTAWVDMRSWQKEDDDGFYRLVCGITRHDPGDSPLKSFNARHVYEWQGSGCRR